MSNSFRKYDVIDYYDSRKISSGFVLEIEDRRLRILNDAGKETKINPSRALNSRPYPNFPTTGARDLQVNQLKSIWARRENVKKDIDLKELWEIVSNEMDEISVEDLSDLVFGKNNNADNEAALVRAMFEDKLYFKLKPDSVEIPSPEKVNQALLQREREEERRNFDSRCAEFLMDLRNGRRLIAEDAPEGLTNLLEEAALYGRDWMEMKQVHTILSHAGLLPSWDPFRILVELSVWSEDENVSLRREDISVDFSPEALHLAQQAAQPAPSDHGSLSEDLHVITIDALSTKDVDDALSIRVEGDVIEVGIHITDVAELIPHDSALDCEIRGRATSIYFPDMKIPMLPPTLSEEAGSLMEGRERRAVTLFVTFTRAYELIEYRLAETKVVVNERLTYEDVDERIANPESNEALMYSISMTMREKRVKAGALIFRDPELLVQVHEDGSLELSQRDREAPSQILVSEMMILANHLYARYLLDAHASGIFRSQPPPLEKVCLGEIYDPVVSYKSKKLLSRGELSLHAAPHSTLGLDVYTTGTSPLRRYTDLIIQRQLKAVLRGETPLTERQLEGVLEEICYKLDRAVQLERERQRYFVLKYLSQRKGQEYECVVLQRFPKFYLSQIRDFCYNGALVTGPGVSLSPGEKTLARIEKVSPRNEKLTLSLVKVLAE